MARTTLTKTAAPGPYPNPVASVAVTMTAADVANGNQFQPSGRDVLIAQNTDASPRNVTISGANDPFGRLLGLTTDPIAAGATRTYPLFKLPGWIQADGFIYV